MFGIALCFLAALFFVEAKTAWVTIGNHSPTDIAAAKALAVERILATPLLSEAMQPVNGHTSMAFLAICAEAFSLPQPTQYRIDLLAGQNLRRISAFLSFAQFNRPPPTL